MKRWIQAARLRTLPLASASVVMGAFLAAAQDGFRPVVSFLALTTTLLLQIIANLANDYGDAVSGADNESRIGPQRAVQSGQISKPQMVKGIWFTIILSSISGVSLLLISTWGHWGTMVTFAILGLTGIGAAVRYTVGDKPYGYSGLGDLFVFLFFGLVGVYGTFYLNTLQIDSFILLPASSLGLLSVGVLNLNNMRDHEQDVQSGKNTLVTRMGFKNAKVYHLVLMIFSIISVDIYCNSMEITYFERYYLIPGVLLVIHAIGVLKINDPVKMDPLLKKLSLITLLFTLTFGASILL